MAWCSQLINQPLYFALFTITTISMKSFFAFDPVDEMFLLPFCAVNWLSMCVAKSGMTKERTVERQLIFAELHQVFAHKLERVYFVDIKQLDWKVCGRPLSIRKFLLIKPNGNFEFSGCWFDFINARKRLSSCQWKQRCPKKPDHGRFTIWFINHWLF